MSSFDERFADRVREVFDAYEEPVDEAALARMRAALKPAPPGAAGRRQDRAPASGATSRRAWRYGAVALAVLALAGGVWMWAGHPDAPFTPDAARPSVAEAPVSGPGDEPAARERTDREGQIAERHSAQPAPVSRQSRAAVSDAPTAVSDASPHLSEAEPTPDPTLPDPTRQETPALADGDADAQPSPVILLSEDRRSREAEVLPLRSDAGAPEGVRLVAATGMTIARGQLTEGAGLSAGVARDWSVASGVRVSGGAVIAYNHFAIGAGGAAVADAFLSLDSDRVEAVDVTTRSTLTTLALEIPLDVAFDLVAMPRGRLSAAVGLTSAVYLTQTIEDDGVTYAYAEAGGGTQLMSRPYAAREDVGPLGRVDLGRQLNLSLGYTPHRGALPVGVEGYVRLPLGGLTSRDLPLTTVGLRLQIALP